MNIASTTLGWMIKGRVMALSILNTSTRCPVCRAAGIRRFARWECTSVESIGGGVIEQKKSAGLGVPGRSEVRYRWSHSLTGRTVASQVV